MADQLWDLIGDHLNGHFSNERLIVYQISHQLDGQILADQVR